MQSMHMSFYVIDNKDYCSLYICIKKVEQCVQSHSVINNSCMIIITGRASSSPSTDLLITLLSMGVKGYKDLLKERKSNYKALQEKLSECAQKHGERLLSTPHNGISMGKLIICKSLGLLFFPYLAQSIRLYDTWILELILISHGLFNTQFPYRSGN